MGIRNGKPVLLPEHLEFLMRTSGLTEDKIKGKYEHFLKEHPDNKITKNVFKEMIEQVRTEHNIDPALTSGDLSGHSW